MDSIDRPYYILPIASTLGQMPSGDLLRDGGPNVILLLSYIVKVGSGVFIHIRCANKRINKYTLYR